MNSIHDECCVAVGVFFDFSKSFARVSAHPNRANFGEFHFHELGGIGYSSRRGLPEMSMKNLVPNSLCP